MSCYPHMLKPLRIKNTIFKNRVLASPITTNRVVIDGIPTPECIDVYETKARGGFAQVTLTESFVDFEFAARHEHGLDLVSANMDTYHMESLAILTEAIKAHGAVASIQLNHVGNVNHPDTCIDHKNPIGPSAFLRADGVWVDEMDEDMLYHVADNFANACGMTKAFGFDMVMLHGGHGWLLSQFLSPLSNKRVDKWGGSLENRARFPLLVLEKVRAEVGADFLIEYRVSGDERTPGGMGIEETIEFCKMIEDKVDIIHVTAGIYHSHVETKSFSSMFDPHGCNLELAAAIKAAVKCPVAAVGGFNSPEQIEAAIASGKCDFVALGRQQFADPEFVNKAMTGRSDEIAPCLRCSCFNPLPSDPSARIVPSPWHCTVNPMANRELRWRQAPKPEASYQVLVIGGGVAGLFAAETAARRGHQVVLAEKTDKLGGTLWFSDTDIHKADLSRYYNALIRRCERQKVEFRLNTTVTPEYIREMTPEVVICAVGADYRTPPIPGVEFAAYALDVYSHPEKIGKEIILIGGGLIGCETGLYLAETGHTVHVLEMRDDIAADGNDSHRRALIPRMKKCMTWECSVKVECITSEGVQYYNENGELLTRNADTVLYATGLKARSELVETLRDSCDRFITVGDCVSPRQIKQAVYEGFCAAMDLV